MIIESKSYRYIIKGAFYTFIVIVLMLLFMIGNFIIKVSFLDYRFDDGELKPPLEVTVNSEKI